MSKNRSYTKGSDRQQRTVYGGRFSEMAGRASVVSEELFTGVERWYLVYKNATKLSVGKSLEHAKRHARNCGGEVRAWNKKTKQLEVLFSSQGEL